MADDYFSFGTVEVEGEINANDVDLYVNDTKCILDAATGTLVIFVVGTSGNAFKFNLSNGKFIEGNVIFQGNSGFVVNSMQFVLK